MNHRIVLKISAALALLFGIALVFAPNALMSLYRADALVSSGIYNSMLYGAMLLGLAVMNWAASEAPEVAEVHYVLLGNLVMDSISFLVAVFRTLTDPLAPPASWLNVAIFLVLTFAFAYVYLSSPAGYKLHHTPRHA